MKKLMILAVAFLAIGATSCKKCKDCTYIQTGTGIPTTTVDVGELCDDDLEEVDGKTLSTNVGGISVTQKYECK